MKMSALAFGAMVAAAGASLAADDAPPGLVEAWNGISGAAIAKHVEILASDAFEGRAPGTHGEDLTLAYIQSQFAEIGLAAGVREGYAQDVPLNETQLTGTPQFSLTIGTETLTPTIKDDYIPRLGRPTERVSIDGDDVVFAGFGAVAPEYGWDDYGDLDLTGKIVILLRGDPGGWTKDEALFEGGAATLHSVPEVKYAQAARRGARGAIVIHTDVSAGYPWSTMTGGGLGQSQHFLDAAAGQAGLETLIHISEPMARRMFAAAGLDFDTEMKAAVTPGFRAHAIGARAHIALDATVKRIVSHNMIGMVRGAEAPDECLLLMAHWDHMGVNPTAEGDQIFNGAVDNATGTAALIEIARAVRAMPRAPRRTIVFVATTAEERGLLGSEYLARNPVCAIEKTVAAIAIDALFPYGAFPRTTMTGFGNSELEETLRLAISRIGRTLQDDGAPEAGAFFRADHFPFVKRGVPGFLAVGGPDNAAPAEDPVMQHFIDYVTNKYHKPDDEYDAATWDMAGIEGDARTLFEFAWRIADDTRFPNWLWSSPFRTLGDERLHPN